MTAPFVLITTHRIHREHLTELLEQTEEYDAFIEANEPTMQGHVAYVDEARREISLVQVHPDAKSVERHFEVAGEHIHRAIDLVDTIAIDVFGEPGPRLRQALDANEAAGAIVSVKPAAVAGFLRS
jgi:hypothetical protein